jgi:hypothetical protein
MGADPNHCDVHGATLFRYCWHTKTAQLLLDHGTDPTSLDDWDDTPLMSVLRNWNPINMIQDPQIERILDAKQRPIQPKDNAQSHQQPINARVSPRNG